jgi:hypothetical protein
MLRHQLIHQKETLNLKINPKKSFQSHMVKSMKDVFKEDKTMTAENFYLSGKRKTQLTKQ